MNPTLPLSGSTSACTGCPRNPSRRRFLAGTACAAGALAAPQDLLRMTRKPKLRLVFAVHAERQPGPDWPNVGFDFAPVMLRYERALADGCPEFEFVTSRATGEQQAKEVLAADTAEGGVDGYVVVQLNCWNRVVQTFAGAKKPVLYVDFQYGGSGGFLVYTAGLLRAKSTNVGFVASSDLADLVAAAKCFDVVVRGGSTADFVEATRQARVAGTFVPPGRVIDVDELKCLSPEQCLARCRETKLLAVRDQTGGDGGELMGIQVVRVPFAEVNDAWQKADPDEAHAVAERWQRAATAVEGVDEKTLRTSAAMYLGMKALLHKHGASGITINCLGGFYGGHIHAYPCLGFHELNNEGLVGGCECDVRSAATMLVGSILAGRPGYISDPVIDTKKRQIVYAHCVASNKVFGPNGPTNPFAILTHSEDRQGASVRSVLPLGFMTTSLEFEPSKKEVLMHRAVAVANDPDDRACRTKLCAEPVGDLEKLFGEWDQWGWHRVTFYGDLREPVAALADALGYKVREEA
ncbi:MAG: twin-arginine translocation signal domain-containing protein [Planctomycetes bacterium]|nr:twin-arginine translocation signal domain-containing protein [Planctomycetota bacterium]